MLQVSGVNLVEGTVPVTLKGVNWCRYYNTEYGGWPATGESTYYTASYRQAAVINNLDAMKEWGVNCLRVIIPCQYWIDDTNSFRDNLQDLLTVAYARGIYVVISPYSIREYPASHSTLLQYGASVTVAEDIAVWTGANMQAIYAPAANDRDTYVAFLAHMYGTLKDNQNLIMELDNEPHGASSSSATDGIRAEFFTMAQAAITAIRAAGANQPILIQFGTIPYYKTGTHGGGTFTWIGGANGLGILFAALTDPQSNLVMSIHCYPLCVVEDDTKTYAGEDYTEVENWSAAIGLDTWAASYPVIIGELGMSHNYPSYPYSPATMYNMVTKFRALGNVGYLGWCWHPDYPSCPLLMGGTVWIPRANEAGEVIRGSIFHNGIAARLI